MDGDTGTGSCHARLWGSCCCWLPAVPGQRACPHHTAPTGGLAWHPMLHADPLQYHSSQGAFPELGANPPNQGLGCGQVAHPGGRGEGLRPGGTLVPW